MEARLKRLEDDFRAIRSDLTTINGRLGSVEGKLDFLTNQVVSKIPSGWTMFSVIVGTLGASVALLTAAAAAAKWLGFLPR